MKTRAGTSIALPFALAWSALAGCKQPPAWLTAGSDASVAADAGALDAVAAGALRDASDDAGTSDAGHAATRRTTSFDVARKEAQATIKALALATAAALPANAAKAKASDCDAPLKALDGALALAPPKITAETRGAYVFFAQCARRSRRWTLLEHLGRLLTALEPSGPHAGFVARAQIGFGQYDAAALTLAPFVKVAGREPEAAATAALASCRVEDDDACVRRADEALAGLKGKTGFAVDDLVADARLARAETFFRRGRLDEALHELDLAAKVGDDREVARLRDACTRAKTTHLGVLADAAEDVPVALYPLFGKANAPLGHLATVRLYNLSGKMLSLHVEVSIPGVTQTAVKDLAFGGKKETVKLTPALSPVFDATGISAGQEGNLTVRILEGDAKKVALEETRRVHLLPRDHVPIVLRARGDELRRSRELLAACVAPKAKATLALVDAAKARVPGKSFAGASGPSGPQVEAIWEELRAQGFSFGGSAPATPAEEGRVEIVRPLQEIAAAKGGSAREGVALVASALAAIGLEPILVDVPGDTYVGWLPTRPDRASAEGKKTIVPSPAGEAIFLEVSAIGQRPFGTAVLRGNAETVELSGEGAFAQERAGMTVLSKAAKAGIAGLRAE